MKQSRVISIFGQVNTFMPDPAWGFFFYASLPRFPVKKLLEYQIRQLFCQWNWIYSIPLNASVSLTAVSPIMSAVVIMVPFLKNRPMNGSSCATFI